MNIERTPRELIGGLVAGAGMVLALTFGSANVAGAQEPQPPNVPPGMPENTDTPPIDEQRPTYAELEAELSEVRIVAENALETAEQAKEDAETGLLAPAAFGIACVAFVMGITARR